MPSLSARLAKLETAQGEQVMQPLRLVISDEPPDEPMIPWTPDSRPAPAVLLVFAGVEYDPGDLGW